MRCGYRAKLLLISLAGCAALMVHQKLSAEGVEKASYTEINLSFPQQSQLIPILISREQSSRYHWRASQELKVRLFTRSAANKLEPVIDMDGKSSWRVILSAQKEGSLLVAPGNRTATGNIIAKIDGMPREESADILGNSKARILEKVYEYRFNDAARIKVHFTEELLEQSGESAYFAKDVLDAAVQAYQTITQFEGFSSVGYSFAFPDTSYAYDPDKTIDIYLGGPTGNPENLNHGFNNLSFKDAPCFDTIKVSDTQYQAVILLPSNYKAFIKNWEHINPSSLGTRNVNVDLRGTLIHEMLHVILFYYNKNLNKDAGVREPSLGLSENSTGKKVDWYVEGLARYFETFAGARHDFFSQGFKQTLPDKIRFSRGGSNYFMRYPDQTFTDLRYENALFWRFIDYRYGMRTIENLSRDFRDHPNRGFELALEKSTQTPFKELLKTFAMAILLKDFGLKDDTVYLKDIAKTHLKYKAGQLYLVDGGGAEKNLGRVCRTDWIGRWENFSAKFKEPPVAGDNTEASDVSGWATDYYQIDLDPVNPELPKLKVDHLDGELPLAVQAVIVTKGGSLLTKDLGDIPRDKARSIDLKAWIVNEGLVALDVERIYLLISNVDPRVSAKYEISVNS